MSKTIFTMHSEYSKVEANKNTTTTTRPKTDEIDESCHLPTTKIISKLPAHNRSGLFYEIKQLSHAEKLNFYI